MLYIIGLIKIHKFCVSHAVILSDYEDSLVRMKALGCVTVCVCLDFLDADWPNAIIYFSAFTCSETVNFNDTFVG